LEPTLSSNLAAGKSISAGNGKICNFLRNDIPAPVNQPEIDPANTADRYSAIRATTTAISAEAIHLACASESGVDLFITLDGKLQKLTIAGIHLITGLSTNLF
jgi:hypothetical protein